MFVDINDKEVSRYIDTTGTFGGGNLYLMAWYVKEGMKVVNIGSQTGMEALFCAKTVGPTGRVYVFEPYSFSYRLMRKSMIVNDVEDWV